MRTKRSRPPRLIAQTGQTALVQVGSAPPFHSAMAGRWKLNSFVLHRGGATIGGQPPRNPGRKPMAGTGLPNRLTREICRSPAAPLRLKNVAPQNKEGDPPRAPISDNFCGFYYSGYAVYRFFSQDFQNFGGFRDFMVNLFSPENTQSYINLGLLPPIERFLTDGRRGVILVGDSPNLETVEIRPNGFKVNLFDPNKVPIWVSQALSNMASPTPEGNLLYASYTLYAAWPPFSYLYDPHIFPAPNDTAPRRFSRYPASLWAAEYEEYAEIWKGVLGHGQLFWGKQYGMGMRNLSYKNAPWKYLDNQHIGERHRQAIAQKAQELGAISYDGFAFLCLRPRLFHRGIYGRG